ncbi:MAG: hypothetical protein WBQ43_20130 [Terriglobales bacterium]
MYPGSFIWRKIGDTWLVSKSASAAFALSAIVILGMTVAIVTTEPQSVGSVVQFFLGIGGILAAVSVFFLWGGMWRYWGNCDSSSLAARRVWFFALVFGLWYGAVLYYLLVYLPNTLRLDAIHTRSSQQ